MKDQEEYLEALKLPKFDKNKLQTAYKILQFAVRRGLSDRPYVLRNYLRCEFAKHGWQDREIRFADFVFEESRKEGFTWRNFLIALHSEFS